MQNQKSVFEFGNEYQCTQLFDVDTQASGVDVYNNGNRIGSIVLGLRADGLTHTVLVARLIVTTVIRGFISH